MFKGLEKDELLGSLGEVIKQAIISVIQMRFVNANALIFAEGDAPEAYYCLLEGEILISKIMLDGAEGQIARLSPPYWFGEMSFLDGQPRTHNAYAAMNVRLAVIPKSEMINLQRNYPDFREALILQLCQHTRALYAAVDNFLLLSPEQLLAKNLVDRILKTGDRNEILLTQDELGRMIGVSRQSVNRILRKWEEKRMISREYSKLVVLDFNAIKSVIPHTVR